MGMGADLASYFTSLSGFPDFNWLGGIDPYGAEWLGPRSAALEREAQRMLAAVHARSVPVPPETDDDNGDLEPLGWTGLESFLEGFLEVVRVAREHQADVIALGD